MVNKVIILGNLGRDPDLRYTQGGSAVASLSVATTRKWTDKGSGERKEETEWHRVSVFGKSAEHCGNYLTKGRQVYVEGRLRTRSYDKDGQKHYTTEIVADTVQFLGGKGEGGGQRGGSSSYASASSAAAGGAGEYDPGAYDGGDDDLPF